MAKEEDFYATRILHGYMSVDWSQRVSEKTVVFLKTKVSRENLAYREGERKQKKYKKQVKSNQKWCYLQYQGFGKEGKNVFASFSIK